MDWVGKTCLKHYLQSIALILLKYLLSMEKNVPGFTLSIT